MGITAGLYLSHAVLASSANLLVNGSFELPPISPRSFSQLNSIPGWAGSASIQVHNNRVLNGGNVFGNQYVELNIESPPTLSQTITTNPGAKYLLTFYFADRPGTRTSLVAMDFTGNTAGTFSVPDTGVVSFKRFTETLTATASQSTLSFAPLGSTIPGEGNLLDNVSLVVVAERIVSVPTPPAAWAGLLMLASLGAIAMTRKQPII